MWKADTQRCEGHQAGSYVRMVAVFNYEHKCAHKAHNCRDNYLPDDEDRKQTGPKCEAKEGGAVQLPDPSSYQRYNVTRCKPPGLN